MGENKIDESILLSIKKLIGGLDEDNTHFDTDLVIFINSRFNVLAQVGVGPDKPFKITGPETLWSEFEYNDLESVKEYIYLKTKLVFDPPLNSSVLQAYKDTASELEWRLNVFSEELKDGE